MIWHYQTWMFSRIANDIIIFFSFSCVCLDNKLTVCQQHVVANKWKSMFICLLWSSLFLLGWSHKWDSFGDVWISLHCLIFNHAKIMICVWLMWCMICGFDCVWSGWIFWGRFVHINNWVFNILFMVTWVLMLQGLCFVIIQI